jgi:hypothetical protein
MSFGLTVGELVDYIILFAALIGAIYKIYDFFAKPTSKIKQRALEKERQRIGAVIDKKMPDILYNHDLQTRDKYKADRLNYLNEIKTEVLNEIGDEIKTNSQTIDALVISAKDVLREKIMAIYHKNKFNRTMTEYEREALNQYYVDYKALNGNSYIDKRYNRMNKWKVIYDDDPYDDEE